jgi:hypothetical protein
MIALMMEATSTSETSVNFYRITLRNIPEVVIGGLVVACLPLDPRFAGSNPAEDDRFLRVIKIRSTTSFGGEVKL